MFFICEFCLKFLHLHIFQICMLFVITSCCCNKQQHTADEYELLSIGDNDDSFNTQVDTIIGDTLPSVAILGCAGLLFTCVFDGVNVFHYSQAISTNSCVICCLHVGRHIWVKRVWHIVMIWHVSNVYPIQTSDNAGKPIIYQVMIYVQRMQSC
jgi:hypothetical protein